MEDKKKLFAFLRHDEFHMWCKLCKSYVRNGLEICPLCNGPIVLHKHIHLFLHNIYIDIASTFKSFT